MLGRSAKNTMNYIDNYSTCEKTHASLNIFKDGLDSDMISNLLNISPSETRDKLWCFSTENRVESLDSRRHVDLLLEHFCERAEQISQLKQQGYRIDISCYWLSAGGHGGPTLSPDQHAGLDRLGIDIWFDVYFLGDDED